MSKGKIDRFLVLHEYQCAACEGNGFIWNPQWEGASEAWDQAEKAALAQGKEWHEAIDAAVEAQDRYWRERGRWKPPPEDIPCGYCQGEGIVRQQVDIMQALAAIVEDDENWEAWRELQETKMAAARGLA